MKVTSDWYIDNGVPLILEKFREKRPRKCDRTFVSRGEVLNGTFSAPELHNPGNHSRQCLYTFLAMPGQRVLVEFRTFDLRGKPPECMHEYLDIYSELASLEAGELVNSAFGGRYCGPIPPRRRVSLHRAIALAFFTDKPYTPATLFAGTFQFINSSEFEVGTPAQNTLCSFTIEANKRKTGALVSPTYPGVYPKDIVCNYQFVGQPGQRIRLEFRDFDLFFGGPHCPFDWVRVFDGPDNTSAVIGTYCGQQRNLVLYSSDERLLVTFFTLPRAANTQNRGFKGMYEFSESFVKLDFISKHDAEHIRGSECDQKILSKKESTGFVYHPNYPFPYIQKVVCRYFIYGMQDSQNLERVRLEFQNFSIPKGQNSKSDGCPDGYLKVYLRGQETTDSYDKHDAELCGESSSDPRPFPPPLVSDGPRLVMVFSSGELQGRGFKAKYTFETEYRVPGTAAPGGECAFTYRSEARKRGELNSPRYPSNYPSRTDCSYALDATPNEQVTVVFDHFKLRADAWNATAGLYGATLWPTRLQHDNGLCHPLRCHIITEYRFEVAAFVVASVQTILWPTGLRHDNGPARPVKHHPLIEYGGEAAASAFVQKVLVLTLSSLSSIWRSSLLDISFPPERGATCTEDWVEAWWTGREGSRVPLGRWCGLATPGPLQSPRGALGLRLALHTDADNVASGFKARYVFEHLHACPIAILCRECSEGLYNLIPAADFRDRSTHRKYHQHHLDGWPSINVRFMRNFLPCAVGLWNDLPSTVFVVGLEEKSVTSFCKTNNALPAKSIFGDCGGNMSGSEWGVIASPRFPKTYEPPERGAASRVCNWYVTARPGKRLLLNFQHFHVEGHLTVATNKFSKCLRVRVPAERGCPAAVLRLWYESPGPPLELCGEKAPADRWQYLSSSNSIRLSFIIADKSVGAAGWRAVWTEVTAAGEAGCGGAPRCGPACLPPAAACSKLQHCADPVSPQPLSYDHCVYSERYEDGDRNQDCDRTTIMIRVDGEIKSDANGEYVINIKDEGIYFTPTRGGDGAARGARGARHPLACPNRPALTGRRAHVSFYTLPSRPSSAPATVASARFSYCSHHTARWRPRSAFAHWFFNYPNSSLEVGIVSFSIDYENSPRRTGRASRRRPAAAAGHDPNETGEAQPGANGCCRLGGGCGRRRWGRRMVVGGRRRRGMRGAGGLRAPPPPPAPAPPAAATAPPPRVRCAPRRPTRAARGSRPRRRIRCQTRTPYDDAPPASKPAHNKIITR
ncbi:Dorsal-ventral patterning tolloid-like protein 1 [Eumeta japonica]|uniref:Dorsal-ventral patterning tolloid-like protein 1 n=1 Tax=Eumeta variegata TaxID=151549 RepID=A0A4C1YTF1_EUMVA|nr:Dorsal-ventral patterning tolloid-like protein 1 [Eumeta japonica]